MSKPGKSLKALCKKLGVRLTIKRGKKRVYKSVKVLKRLCKSKAGKKKKKRPRRRKFGMYSGNNNNNNPNDNRNSKKRPRDTPNNTNNPEEEEEEEDEPRRIRMRMTMDSVIRDYMTRTNPGEINPVIRTYIGGRTQNDKVGDIMQYNIERGIMDLGQSGGSDDFGNRLSVLRKIFGEIRMNKYGYVENPQLLQNWYE